MGEGQQIFVGRLGKNPFLAYAKGGVPVCEMSLALDKQIEGKTIWRRIVTWGRLAEVCSVQLKKGNSVFVQGQIVIRNFFNKEGEKKTVEEVVANKIALSFL